MKIHFVGIGGISMSGLARYFKAKEFTISGSDLRASDLTTALRREGMRIVIGPHSAKNIPAGTDVVVYNRAVPPNNPELAYARKKHIPLLPLAEALGRLTQIHKTIAITGSHGKSTTTALAAVLLMKNGFDPTVFIGTNLRELGGKNIRIGKSPWLVLEADDFGKAFLSYSPTVAIVTNIDREHLDFYKTLTNLQNSFLQFLGQTHEHGTLILNKDNETLFSLGAKVAALARKKHLAVIWYSAQEPLASGLKKRLQLPGKHNLSNSVAVYHLGELLEIPRVKIISALGSYKGAWRRMEYRGIARLAKHKVPVFDDYAHHPTEIKATLQAFREKFPSTRLICVFQPHQTERLRLLFKEFQSSFLGADTVILLPSYKVAGRDVQDKNFTSEKLAEAIKKTYPEERVHYLADPSKLKSFLAAQIAPPKSVVIMMGAGDIVNYTASLLK
jgi:UDP-N-acetylmuramate--alanine ligase